MDRTGEAAALIARARLDGRPLAPLPAELRPDGEAEAYRILDAVHARLVGNLGPRIGWKIGCTTPVMQAYLGIGNPVAAALYSGGRHASGAVLPAAAFRRPGVECEIAVRLGRDLAERPSDLASAAGALDASMAAIEIVDDRYVDWRTTDAGTLIADDFFSAGCGLGEPVAPSVLADPHALVGTTTVNGTEVGRGRGSDVMGSPLAALAWLAGHLAARGQRLAAGEIVLTGSLVETRWIGRGDRAEIAITGLGSVSLRLD